MNSDRTLIGIVRLVRSLADRTFQPTAELRPDHGLRLVPLLWHVQEERERRQDPVYQDLY